jgi:hypothetical protein
VAFLHGQQDLEPAPWCWLLRRPLVRLHHRLNNAPAEAEAVLAATFVSAVETLPDVWRIGLANTQFVITGKPVGSREETGIVPASGAYFGLISPDSACHRWLLVSFIAFSGSGDSALHLGAEQTGGAADYSLRDRPSLPIGQGDFIRLGFYRHRNAHLLSGEVAVQQIQVGLLVEAQ